MGSSRKKLYENLGWESLNDRLIMRKLCILHETYHNNFPRYLDDIISEVRPARDRLNDQKIIYNIPCRTDYFSRSFFPSTIKDWNSVELVDLRGIVSKSIFKNKLLQKIRLKKKPIFGLSIHNRVRHIFMLRRQV